MAEWDTNDPEKFDQEDEILDRDAVAKVKDVMATGRKKRKKFDHALFFDDEMGFKKLLKDFSKVKFRGKGYEKEDLKLMMRNYRQWFSELLVQDGDLEEYTRKTRSILLKLEKDPPSDPKERLTKFRCQYKNPSEADAATASDAKALSASSQRKALETAPASTTLSEDQLRRIAENKQKALEKKRQREAEEGNQNIEPARAVAAKKPDPEPAELDMEVQWRIEENRLKALEKQKQKELEASRNEPPAAAAAKVAADLDDPFGMDDDFPYPEDDFDFGGGLDE